MFFKGTFLAATCEYEEARVLQVVYFCISIPALESTFRHHREIVSVDTAACGRAKLIGNLKEGLQFVLSGLLHFFEYIKRTPWWNTLPIK